MSANEAEAETQRLREQCRSLTVALEGVNIHIRNLLKGAVTGQFDGDTRLFLQSLCDSVARDVEHYGISGEDI